MQWLYNVLLISAIPFIFVNCHSNNGLVKTEEQNEKEYDIDKLSFREIVDMNFPSGNVFIGAATHYNLLSAFQGEILNQFSYITPANSFKLTRIHPQPGQWDWQQADEWIARGKKGEQVIRLHAPISPQCSKWVKHDDRKAEELDEILVEYMTALCKRYNSVDNVKWLDVVNETIAPDGTWFGPKAGDNLWENPWTIMGHDNNHPLHPPIYIKKAFEIANEHAPDIKLIINQHGQFEPEVWEKMKELVQYLRQSGLRIDGVGWQAHVNVGWEKEGDNQERLSDWISWAHDHDLEFHVTENTVWIKDKAEWEQQAETFASILRTLLVHRESGIVGWNLWQLVDQDTQKKANGCIFDEGLHPKPAYYAIKELLLNPPEIVK